MGEKGTTLNTTMNTKKYINIHNFKNSNGFTLLEIILVLALISAIASVILPNLRVTIDSQMSVSITNLSSQIRSAYDNAIFTGRMQRMVFDVRHGEFWTEQAPPNFRGRPPLVENDKTKDQLKESNKKAFLDMLNEKEQNGANRQSPYSSDENPVFYTSRSIPVVQKSILEHKEWSEVSDSLIKKTSLSGKIVFAKFSSSLNPTPIEFSYFASLTDKNETKYAYIYFLPDGTTTSTSIQLGVSVDNIKITENDLKFTLNLNTLTGQINLLEGFQDANFKLSTK
jgi:prepilin-type N-terminal cleavage/methylation domain-containing protein